MATVTSAKAYYELVDAVEEYASYAHWYYAMTDEGEECRQCIHCDAQFSMDDEEEDPDDENLHEEDCMWRRIKEAHANLTNEGY